jgi:hypothetical protein
VSANTKAWVSNTYLAFFTRHTSPELMARCSELCLRGHPRAGVTPQQFPPFTGNRFGSRQLLQVVCYLRGERPAKTLGSRLELGGDAHGNGGSFRHVCSVKAPYIQRKSGGLAPTIERLS